jgi:PAP2 superfamily
MGTRFALFIALALTACEADSADPPAAPVAAADDTRQHRLNPVIRWSKVAHKLMVDPGPVIDSRAFAILYAAIHDAVNGIERRYEPYAADLSFPGASVDAAVATAAKDVLIALSPSTRSQTQAEYTEALAEIPEGKPRADGIRLGHRAARLNLARREGDQVPAGPWPPQEGPITRPRYTPNGNPGNYAFTPPFDAPPLGPVALFPGWGRLDPFVSSPVTHPLDGPDPLRSGRYAKDVNQVKLLGRQKSPTRTRDQTEIAHFWFEDFAVWNDIATSVVEREVAGTWRAARILALVHFAMADAGFACFEAKYRYRFWRPFTAIRRAAEDGNPATTADPHWRPLLWHGRDTTPPVFLIPPIPEYPSAAATISGAAAEVLTRHLGDGVAFEATSIFAPGVRRRFTGFKHAAREAGLSRVYGGIHFLDAVEDGLGLGKAVGAEVSKALPAAGRLAT